MKGDKNMDENKRIIEVNGVKIEVDLRSAKRIDEFKVGGYRKGFG